MFYCYEQTNQFNTSSTNLHNYSKNFGLSYSHSYSIDTFQNDSKFLFKLILLSPPHFHSHREHYENHDKHLLNKAIVSLFTLFSEIQLADFHQKIMMCIT